jgi:hypothetical protein
MKATTKTTPTRSRCAVCRKLAPVKQLDDYSGNGKACAACRLAEATCNIITSREPYTTCDAKAYIHTNDGYVCEAHYYEFYGTCEGCGTVQDADAFFDPKGRGLCASCVESEDAKEAAAQVEYEVQDAKYQVFERHLATCKNCTGYMILTLCPVAVALREAVGV